jgi:hypothetical protein
MPRFVLTVLVIGLSVYALADCLQTPNPKALPKLVWVAIIVLLPVIGPLLWILFGRTNGRGWGRGGDDDYSSGFSTGGANKPSGPRESYDLNDDIPF